MSAHVHEDAVCIIVTEDIIKHLNHLKESGVNSFIIYKIVNMALVKEDFLGVADVPKRIADHLPKNECRYVIYNYAHGPHGHEILLILW